MAAPRIKSRWFRDATPRDPAELASAAAAIVWRTADYRVRHMRSVNFAIDAGEPYIAALVEFLCFLIAIADRVAYERDPGPWRTAFTSALAIRVGELFRWGADQAMSVEGPAAAETVAGALRALFGAPSTRAPRTIGSTT